LAKTTANSWSSTFQFKMLLGRRRTGTASLSWQPRWRTTVPNGGEWRTKREDGGDPRTRDLDDPKEMSYCAAEVLGQALGVSRVGFGTVDKAAETITITRDWNAHGITTLAGVPHFRDYDPTSRT
jgi:hypothetical protein